MQTKHILLGLLAGIAAGILLITRFTSKDLSFIDQKSTAPPQVDSSTLLEDEKNTIAVFQHASRSVVFITSRALQFDLFSMDISETPQGSGSGFVWDTKGHIVTNYHVIVDAASLSVTLHDHSEYKAKVVGSDPSKDLAVLRIDTPTNKLRAVTVGSSDRLQVGQKVIAIGNPFGLDETLTVGVVSALGRQIRSVSNRTIQDVVQTDAAINPGNSGGPLLDSNGNLIGINTAIYSPSGASAGIGFAVPANTVKRIVPELIEHGKVTRPGLGVRYLSDSVARRLEIEGVMIGQIERGSAADKAGLRGLQRNWRGELIAGDIIYAVNDEKVTNFDELSNALENYQIGDRVTIHFLREDKKESIEIQLQAESE